MLWRGVRRSSNIEDRRGARPVAIAGGGGTLLAAAFVVYLLGGDPFQFLASNIMNMEPPRSQLSAEEEKQEADFVSAILGSTEDVWTRHLPETAGVSYIQPKLVLFTGGIDSACGFAQSATGPFYCQLDGKVYLDLGFFKDLENALNSPGDFARAYVIAHEVGHHIQALQGTAQKVTALQRRASRPEANALSVSLELQADCYAGVWAQYVQADNHILETGDIDEALNAASQIGDDRLQQEGQGYVVPDSFTHGSSAQRRHWFLEGLKAGTIKSCDTFDDG